MSAQEEKKTVDVAAEEEQKQEEGEDLVTAWDIQAASDKGVDYDKLLEKFGCFPMTPELIERVEKLSEQKAHRFIRRGIFFCQRDLEVVLNSY